ncbi:MAG: hypothetical protein JXA54_08040 [Candidatus Heimdallarchaeota archaeon]|nr:hypothetical protein [Candidatus Heimdallarchaeota archaeon]
MSSDNDYKKLLTVGSVIGIFGAIAVAIGMFLSYGIIGSGTTDIFGLTAVSLVIGIFIICLITLIGVLSPRTTINEERPGLIALAIFIFAPTSFISQYSTPMFYLLSIGNDMLSSADFGFYIGIIGLALLLVAFFAYAWIFLWKNRTNATSGLNLSGSSSEIGFVKVLRIFTSLFIIIAGVGIVLAMCIPPYTGTLPAGGLIMTDTRLTLDLTAIAFFVEIAGIIITAFLVMIGNFGTNKPSRSEVPLLAFTSFLIIYPGYKPASAVESLWSSPIYELLVYVHSIIVDPTKTINIWGWILLVSVLIFVFSFFLGILSFFFNKSAVRREAPSAVSSGLEPKRKKKEKFPTGPPSATSGPPVGGLAAQLSGPPSASAGPPSAPSFMSTSPSSGPPASSVSDAPTCPFCGKPLRFINEYQRWYCDSCAQYV